MASKWFIHRDNTTLGPWSAERIRVALRKGEVDPFDMVNLEGSPVMRELVEIDEIFLSSEVSYAELRTASNPPQEMSKEAPSSFMALADPNIDSPRAKSKKKRPSGRRDKPLLSKKKNSDNFSAIGATTVSARSESTRAGSNVKVKDPKRYFLIDSKGCILGPMSAGEIQSQFYKGVFKKDIMVRKSSSTVSVPIDKFVNVYAQAKGKKGEARKLEIAAHPMSKLNLNQKSPFQELLDSIKLGFGLIMTSRHLNMLGALVLIGAVAFGLYSYQQNLELKKKLSSKVVIDKEMTKKEPVEKKAEDRLEMPQMEIKPESTKLKVPQKKRAVVTPSRSGSLTTPQNYKKPNYNYQKTTKSSRRPRREGVIPARNMASVSVGSLRTKDGQKASIGPLFFSPDDLNRCTLKCDIPMRDDKGQVIQVKFFKGEFGNDLVGKSRKVYIEGMVSGGGTILFLNSVK